MRYIVKVLRQRGARRSERDIMAETGTVGQLSGAHIGSSFELKLFGGDGSRMEPIIPVLLDARLVSMHDDKMLFKGVEQGVDGAQFVQEWSVKVMAEKPQASAPSERMG